VREEPDAGNPHVRVCEGRGRQRPRLLGQRTRTASGRPMASPNSIHVPGADTRLKCKLRTQRAAA